MGRLRLRRLKFLPKGAFCSCQMSLQAAEASLFLILNGCKTIKAIIGQKLKFMPNCKKSWKSLLKMSIIYIALEVLTCVWPLIWQVSAEWRKHPDIEGGYRAAT